MIRSDAVIIGAGAAGLFCALEAARRGLTVTLLDHQERPGLKLSLAGGGMGNVTNLDLDPRHYIGAHTTFCKKPLARFGTRDTLRLLTELAIPWEEREFGQIFCLTPAARLVENLEAGCRATGVSFRMGLPVTNVQFSRDEATFTVRTKNEAFSAFRLVLATGGPAIPQAGATDFGSRTARALGHRVVPFRPVLVPLVMPPDWPLLGLEGISLPARVTIRKRSGSMLADPCGIRSLLFTHQGVSGPAILVASCFWEPGDIVMIDWLPQIKVLDLLHDPGHGKLLIKNLMARYLPGRLAERLIPQDLASRKAAETGKKDRLRLAGAVHAHTVVPSGTAGFKKAEAAAGGVDTNELKATMESKLVSGLFVIGELTDITGLLGGYNIHWAFASAFAAAEAMSGA